MGILTAEMARRLRAGTSAIELAIRRKTPKRIGKCDNCELRPLASARHLDLAACYFLTVHRVLREFYFVPSAIQTVANPTWGISPAPRNPAIDRYLSDPEIARSLPAKNISGGSFFS